MTRALKATKCRDSLRAGVKGCGYEWTSVEQAHCVAGSVDRFVLLPLGDGDSQLRPKGNSRAGKRSPNRRRVSPNRLPDLLTGKARLVEGRHLLDIELSTMHSNVLSGGKWGKVSLDIVGFDAIDVMDVTLIFDPTSDPMLVGLDVLALPDLPSKTDVSGTVGVSTRYSLGDRLSGPQRSNAVGVSSSSSPALVTDFSLPDSGKLLSTASTRDGDHGLSIALHWSCHEHFAGNSVADRHWIEVGDDPCVHIHPSEVVTKSGSKVGRNILEQDEDGIWHQARP